MNQEQLRRMHEGKGFIAALDQSGGSTPKALALYGVAESAYASEEEMYRLVHEMRTRIIKSPAFTGEHILGAILFEDTMNRQIDGAFTADYLWQKKQVIPFLKIDKGLAERADGVQLMKPMPTLDSLLQQAVAKNIFGTKMRSVIWEANQDGIAAVIDQQFAIGKQIASARLVPILEPEVDIHSKDRREAETLMRQEIRRHLAGLDKDTRVMFKFSIPVEDNFYADLMRDPHVVRVVALSGGFSRNDANEKLAANRGLIASFSRALSEGLSAGQSEADFDAMLARAVKGIYDASIT